MEHDSKFEKRIDRIRTLSVIFLIISILITAVAWASSFVSISGNLIQLGKVDIEVGYYDDNGNKRYYADDVSKTLFDELTLSRRTVEKTFFIENKGNLDAYFTFYFENIEGSYGDELLLTIKDADTGQILLGGNENPVLATAFVEDNYKNERLGVIEAGTTKKLFICFEHFVSDVLVDNIFKFDFCVKAVQTKNNP